MREIRARVRRAAHVPDRGLSAAPFFGTDTRSPTCANHLKLPADPEAAGMGKRALSGSSHLFVCWLLLALFVCVCWHDPCVELRLAFRVSVSSSVSSWLAHGV